MLHSNGITERMGHLKYVECDNQESNASKKVKTSKGTLKQSSEQCVENSRHGPGRCRENRAKKKNTHVSPSNGDEMPKQVMCIQSEQNDFFNFQPRPVVQCYPPPCRTIMNSNNFAYFIHRRNQGLRQSSKQTRSAIQPLIDLIENLRLFRVASPFDRRITVLAWHPVDANVLVAGSKNGDLVCINVHDVRHLHSIEGIGPGGQLNALKFWPNGQTKILTAAVDGTVSLYDFQDGAKRIFLDTMSPVDKWYCSLDVSQSSGTLLAGDNRGNVNLLSLEGKTIWTKRLHKNKVAHLEFNALNPWMVASAGLDKTVKLWDIRKIENQDSALFTLPHLRGVNSAYFSLTNGTRLLTTDQDNEINIFQGPTWHCQTLIKHPHRFFQHITPIKAQWHPLADIVTVGRYPDPKCPGSDGNEPRTIDVFCGDTGRILNQIMDYSAPGLISLNSYNRCGDMLASSMGQNILVWRRREELTEKQEALLKSIETSLDAATTGKRRKDTGNAKNIGKVMKSNLQRQKKQLSLKTKAKENETDSKRKGKK